MTKKQLEKNNSINNISQLREKKGFIKSEKGAWLENYEKCPHCENYGLLMEINMDNPCGGVLNEPVECDSCGKEFTIGYFLPDDMESIIRNAAKVFIEPYIDNNG